MDEFLKKLLQSRSKRLPRKVEVEPGCFLFVSELTPNERDLMEMQWVNFNTSGSNVGFRAYVVAWCLSDENNNRVFDSGQDEEQLNADFVKHLKDIGNGETGMSLSLISKLYDVAAAASGISGEDQKEMEKPFAIGPADGGNGSRPKRRGKAGRRG